jgi:hypothetical protein
MIAVAMYTTRIASIKIVFACMVVLDYVILGVEKVL